MADQSHPHSPSNGEATEPSSAQAPTGGGYLDSPAQSPLALLRRFVDDMDRIVTEFGAGHSLSHTGTSAARPLTARPWTPQVEVFEKNGILTVRADLPGLRREDIQVHADDELLVIEGERRHQYEDSQGRWFHSERSYGSFRRAVRLPRGTRHQEIRASFDHGVLEITLPAPRHDRRGHRIDIGGREPATGSPSLASPGASGPDASEPPTRHARPSPAEPPQASQAAPPTQVSQPQQAPVEPPPAPRDSRGTASLTPPPESIAPPEPPRKHGTAAPSASRLAPGPEGPASGPISVNSRLQNTQH